MPYRRPAWEPLRKDLNEFRTIWLPSDASTSVVVAVGVNMGAELFAIGLIQFSEKPHVMGPFVWPKRSRDTVHGVKALSETIYQNLQYLIIRMIWSLDAGEKRNRTPPCTLRRLSKTQNKSKSWVLQRPAWISARFRNSNTSEDLMNFKTGLSIREWDISLLPVAIQLDAFSGPALEATVVVVAVDDSCGP
jgi:hypothetical protein